MGAAGRIVFQSAEEYECAVGVCSQTQQFGPIRWLMCALVVAAIRADSGSMSAAESMPPFSDASTSVADDFDDVTAYINSLRATDWLRVVGPPLVLMVGGFVILARLRRR